MKIIEGYEAVKSALLRRTAEESPDRLERELVVRQIVDDVHARGDAALYEYTQKFDGVKLASLEVDRKQVDGAYRKVDKELISALELAAERITAFHAAQKDILLRESTDGNLGWLLMADMQHHIDACNAAGIPLPEVAVTTRTARSRST